MCPKENTITTNKDQNNNSDNHLLAQTIHRTLGALEVIGGISEMGVGAALITAGSATMPVSGGSSLALVVGGLAITTHGADGVVAGTKQAITGEHIGTLSQELLKPYLGENAAAVVDAAASMFGPAVGVYKLAALSGGLNPSRFHVSRGWDDFCLQSSQISKITLEETRALKGEHNLVYVVDTNNKLHMAIEDLTTPLVSHGGRVTHSIITPEILGIFNPVKASGRATIIDGTIAKLNNFDPYFQPYGKLLKPTTEIAFVREGYTEAKGLFKYFKNTEKEIPSVAKLESIVKMSEAEKIENALRAGLSHNEIYAFDEATGVLTSPFALKQSKHIKIFPYDKYLKKPIENICERFGYSIEEFFNYPINTEQKYNFLEAGMIGLSRMVSYDFGKLNIMEAFIPSASAATPAMPSAALFLSIDQLQQTYKMFQDPTLLDQASPQTLAAAIFMQNTQHNYFGLGDQIYGLDKTKLYNALYTSIQKDVPEAKVRTETMQQLIESGMLGEPETISQYYPTLPIEYWLSHYTDKEKQQDAPKLMAEIQDAIRNNKPLSKEAADDFSKLLINDISPALEEHIFQILKAGINSYSSEIDITGFEDNPKVVKGQQELITLVKQGAPIVDRMAKAKEIQNTILQAKLQQQQFNKKLQIASNIEKGANIAAKLFHNDDLNRAIIYTATIISSGYKISGLINVGLAGLMTPAGIGVALDIVGNVLGLFANNGQDIALQTAILEAVQRVSLQITQLRADMFSLHKEEMQAITQLNRNQFETYYALKGGLDDLAARIAYKQATDQKFQQNAFSYFESILQYLEHMSKETKKNHKVDKLKAIKLELANKKKEFDSDPGKYATYLAALNTYLTDFTLGTRDAEFTGANSPLLSDPLALKEHIDSFFTDFHAGTLAKLLTQLNFKAKNHSPELMQYYLSQTLQNNPDFQLVPCVIIKDIVNPAQRLRGKVLGLAKELQQFMQKPTANVLIIPIKLHAKWQLIIVDKLLKQRTWLMPVGSQSNLLKELEAVVEQYTAPDFITLRMFFDNQVSQSDYGAIIVELVKRLSKDNPYADLLIARDHKKLEVFRQEHIATFKPTQELLDSQNAFLTVPTNPILTEILSLKLIDLYYTKYPQVLSKKTVDFAIDATEIDLLLEPLIALENAYSLRQALLDEDFLKTLFKTYNDAVQSLHTRLMAYKEEYEKTKTTELTIAIKEKMRAQFTGEIAKQFNQDVPIKIYGNWFNEVSYYCRCHNQPHWRPCCNHPSCIKLGDNKNQSPTNSYINAQTEQFRQFKETFLFSARNKIDQYQFTNKFDLYNPNYFTVTMLPIFIKPTEPTDPILPNFAFTEDISLPKDVAQAVAIGVGELNMDFAIYKNINKFATTINFNFAMDPFNIPIFEYSTTYKDNDGTTNFYEGPEGVARYWWGGKGSNQKTIEVLLNNAADFWNPIDLNHIVMVHNDCSEHHPLGSGYVIPTIVNHQGIGHSPLSSFTKDAITVEQKTKSKREEIKKLVASKHQEMISTFHTALEAQLNNLKEPLGDALIQTEVAYKVLRLALEANGMDTVIATLFNNTAFNTDKILTFIGTVTPHYVAEQLISAQEIMQAQTLCLQQLITLANKPLGHIDSVQEDLLRAYEYFLPYRVEKPKPYELEGWEMKLHEYVQRKASYLENALDKIVDSNPTEQEQMMKEHRENRKQIQIMNKEVAATNKKVQTGELTSTEALAELNARLKMLKLSASTSLFPDTTLEPIVQTIQITETTEETEIDDDVAAVEQKNDASKLQNVSSTMLSININGLVDPTISVLSSGVNMVKNLAANAYHYFADSVLSTPPASGNTATHAKVFAEPQYPANMGVANFTFAIMGLHVVRKAFGWVHDNSDEDTKPTKLIKKHKQHQSENMVENISMLEGKLNAYKQKLAGYQQQSIPRLPYVKTTITQLLWAIEEHLITLEDIRDNPAELDQPIKLELKSLTKDLLVLETQVKELGKALRDDMLNPELKTTELIFSNVARNIPKSLPMNLNMEPEFASMYSITRKKW